MYAGDSSSTSSGQSSSSIRSDSSVAPSLSSAGSQNQSYPGGYKMLFDAYVFKNNITENDYLCIWRLESSG